MNQCNILYLLTLNKFIGPWNLQLRQWTLLLVSRSDMSYTSYPLTLFVEHWQSQLDSIDSMDSIESVPWKINQFNILYLLTMNKFIGPWNL